MQKNFVSHCQTSYWMFSRNFFFVTAMAVVKSSLAAGEDENELRRGREKHMHTHTTEMYIPQYNAPSNRQTILWYF